MTSIEEFMEKKPTTAEKKKLFDQQKEVLVLLTVLTHQEQDLARKINRESEGYQQAAENAHGQFMRQDPYDFGQIATQRKEEELDEIRKEIKPLFLKAVRLNLEHLDFIQNNYQQYVGEPLL